MNRFIQISTAISVFFLTAFAYAGVTVSSPTNGSTVGTSINVVASATTSCSKGVASMGIYPTPNWLVYTVGGHTLNTNISLNPGTYTIVVQEWDYCGGASTSSVTVTVKTSTGVYVSSPANNSTVGSPVTFAASATTSCSKGVASMGIYTAPNQLAYVGNGASLNTSLSLGAGTYYTTVTEWDYCGGASSTPVKITVNGSGGNTLYNIQKAGGWNSWAQQPPSYQDCLSCTPSGPGTTWAEYQGISNPSLSGSSTQFNLGGNMAYSDVLWNNHLIGPFSSQGLPDTNHTLVPSLHTFTYDVWFYSGNLNVSQALEFDINQFFNTMGFTWGHECRVYGGHEWDVWDAAHYKWVPTGIACNPIENSWNHLTIVVSRTSNNQETYQSITLNGVTNTLNWTYSPFWVPSDWWGVTVNYQQDGNYAQQAYTVYVDKLNFTYQ